MYSSRLAILTLSGGLLGQPRLVPGPAAPVQAAPADATPIDAGRPDGVGAGVPADLTPQEVEDLSDLLTIVLWSLERLAREPLTQAARNQLDQAGAATFRSGEILWQAAGTRSPAPAGPSYQPFHLEQGP